MTALVLALLGAIEWAWRAGGQRPSITDDAELWSYNRSLVYGSMPQDSLVLIGTSRMQLDIDISTMQALLLDKKIIQLAVDGSSPLPVLRDLGLDERFTGIVICDIAPEQLARLPAGDQQTYVEHFHQRQNLNNRLNKIISVFFQSHLALMSNPMPLPDLIDILSTPDAHLSQMHLVTYPDRSRSADYNRDDIVQYRQKRFDRDRLSFESNKPLSSDKWQAAARQVEPWIQQLQSRGGAVIFVNLPTASPLSELYEQYYPKTDYWDKFATNMKGKTLHFKDSESLRRFKPPDGSHLDFRDKAAFTKAFVTELLNRRMIGGPH